MVQSSLCAVWCLCRLLTTFVIPWVMLPAWVCVSVGLPRFSSWWWFSVRCLCRLRTSGDRHTVGRAARTWSLQTAEKSASPYRNIWRDETLDNKKRASETGRVLRWLVINHHVGLSPCGDIAMRVYRQAGLSSCGFIANGGEILQYELMGTGDVWRWIFPPLAINPHGVKPACRYPRMAINPHGG